MLSDFFAFVLIAVVVLGGILGGANIMGQRQCATYQELNGKRTIYVWFDTCYVELDGRMERWDAYKMRVTTKSGN